MWTPSFWKDAAERAIRTMAQVMVTMIVAAGTGLLDTDWFAYLSAAGMSGLLSVLTSVASEVKSPNGTASLVGSRALSPPVPDGAAAGRP